MIEILFSMIGIYVALVTIGVILITLRPDRDIIYKRLTDERESIDNDFRFYFKLFRLLPFSIWFSIVAIIRG